MAKYDELPVFKATYDLLLRIYMVSQHWSRDIRYTLGEELKKEVIEILQLIYQANASKKKVAFLSSCRVKLIKVRLQIRVAKDLKQLHLNQYGLLAEMQENISKHYQGWLTTDADFHYTVADFDNLSQQGIADMLYDRGMQILQAKEVRYGAPVMRELERICLLKCVDRQWMDHIDNMDQLRQGIALRGYGQKDPVVEYRIEGFDMFDQMVDSIRESSVKMLLTIELRAAGSAPKREQVAKPTGEGFVPGNGAPGVKGSPKGQPVRVVKIGRNDPCPCGSGLKFKKCTCAQYHPTGNNGGEE